MKIMDLIPLNVYLVTSKIVSREKGGKRIHTGTCVHRKKNIRRFYGKITGNQLPVHFPLFFTGARKHFQESGEER